MVTTQLLWRAAILFSLVDVVAIGLTLSLVTPARFLPLKRASVVAAFLVWFGIWGGVVSTSWDSVYSYVFPAASRWFLPPLFGCAFALAALLFFSLGQRAGRYSVVLFILLGACLGPITHLNAVLRGIVEKPPMLRGASPLAAIVVAFPEFAFYWCLIVLLAASLARLFPALRHRPFPKV
jgi:hypothetical protein